MVPKDKIVILAPKNYVKLCINTQKIICKPCFDIWVNPTRAFHELRRYLTRPLRLNLGPKNVHFGKTHFWDPTINARVFIQIKKITRRNYFMFCIFHYGTKKTTKKRYEVQKTLKNDKIVISRKK